MSTMTNISKMITLAIGASGENVNLKVGLTKRGEFAAELTGEDGEVMTSPVNWSFPLTANGKTVDEAICALDSLCFDELGR